VHDGGAKLNVHPRINGACDGGCVVATILTPITLAVVSSGLHDDLASDLHPVRE